MNTFLKTVGGVGAGLLAVVGVGWLGLQVPPRVPPPTLGESQARGAVDIPADLPAPVQRYLQVACGAQIPRMESMVTWGRARANFGIWMPLRYQLTHRPGVAFRRDMEVTWFGMPTLTALDQYLDGQGMTGPVGNAAMGPEIDQGANMILWAEAMLMPSLLVSDPRVRWEAIDDTSARLIFPFDGGEDEVIFSFDSETGLITRVWAMRYKEPNSAKEPWRVDILDWQTVDGIQVPRRVAVVWENEGKPWSYWDFDGVLWNVDVSNILPQESALDAAHAEVAQP